MKHVQACLCTKKDGEIMFEFCRAPVKLVQACLSAGKT